MKPVQVLLSTYNGTRWLAPQIESVLQQDHTELTLLVRDDGSSDGTGKELERLRREAPQRMRWFQGGNVGPQASFFELLARADGAAYFAFCDQDDVWLPDKISRAVAQLDDLDPEKPRMYCSRQTLVDEGLKVIGHSRLAPRGPAFANALVENIATGCTVVLDAAAREAVLHAPPDAPVMHDWWAYLVVSALGGVVFDPESRLLYRQHGGNVVGAQHVVSRNFLTRVQRFRRHKERYTIWEQAVALRDGYGDRLEARRKEMLDRFIARRNDRLSGLRYAFAPGVFRQTRLDDWIMRALIATARI